jgi:predicted dehydrogenase
MKQGKDFLSDKPAVTTLEQLAEVRKVSAETGKMFAIMYSERLEVRAAVQAGYLIKAGAIGKVVQTVNIAPHKVNDITRPDWFWDPAEYGGILCDIGSHQADQFVYYTGSTTAEVTGSQIANVNHPTHPKFQDFGDMMVHGNAVPATFGWIGLPPMDLASGAMADSSSSAPTVTLSCANTSISPANRAVTTCLWWTRSR